MVKRKFAEINNKILFSYDYFLKIKNYTDTNYKYYKLFLDESILHFINNNSNSNYKLIYNEPNNIDIPLYNNNIFVYPTINLTINNYYLEYIRIILNLLNLPKAFIHLYKFNKINNKFNETIIKNIYNKKTDTNIFKLDYNWIGASKVRNAALNDHFVDYCKEYNIKDIDDNPKKRNRKKEIIYNNYNNYNKKLNNNTFLEYILSEGIKFEEKIINLIKDKFSDNFIKICDATKSRDVNNFHKTIKEMNKGTPIIYQAILYNYKYKCFGSVDLLVRSDWINKIVKTRTDYDYDIKAPKLDISNHYVVIDIKHSKLNFNSDNLTLRNNSSMKAFKSQITIYNHCLAECQGYMPKYAFIIGNGWTYSRIRNKIRNTDYNNDPLNRLGIIDYYNKDFHYLKSSLDNIKWIKQLYNSNNWNHLYPTNNFLYPNMNHKTTNDLYHKIKKQIAERNYEITNIWNCSLKHRYNAFKYNIKSWKDKRCNCNVLGINGKNKNIIDNMINFNRSNKGIINLKKINNNDNNWRNNNKVNLYLDFETIGSMFLKDDIVFLVGIGYKIPNEEYNFKYFFINKLNKKEEKKLLENMNMFIKKLDDKHGINNVYHWSNAEPIIYKKLLKRHNIINNIKWFDLLKFFKKNVILIKDCFNFSLKTIVSKMNKYKLIKLNYDNSISSGLDAMIQAHDLYKNNNLILEKDLNDIINYNKLDCSTLYQILDYLRNTL